MVLRGSRLCVGPWGSPLAEGEMRGLQEPVLRGDEGSCPPFGAPLTAPRPGWGAGFGGTRVESSLAFWDTHTHHTHTDTSHGAQAGGGCPWLIVPRLDMEMCPA